MTTADHLEFIALVNLRATLDGFAERERRLLAAHAKSEARCQRLMVQSADDLAAAKRWGIGGFVCLVAVFLLVLLGRG